jgi:hypothetical protein
MVTVRPYDYSMKLPGPVAVVIVSHPTSNLATRFLPGKMDTGSDITVVPTCLAADRANVLLGRDIGKNLAYSLTV